jgi:hypothetical protein
MKAPQEYKVISLRECPTPEAMQLCDTPERAVEYWQHHIAPHPYFNPECECLIALLLNTRRRVKGHQLLSFGTTDTLLVSPSQVFRTAVIAAAPALVSVAQDRVDRPRHHRRGPALQFEIVGLFLDLSHIPAPALGRRSTRSSPQVETPGPPSGVCA